MTTFTATSSLKALAVYALCWLSVMSTPALAAGSPIKTREDTPVPIPLANISSTPCTNIYPVTVPGTGEGNVQNNGASLYVNNPPVPTACADISAGQLSWTPGLNQTFATAFTFRIDTDPTVYTLDLTIDTAVNDPPFLGNNLVNGSGFPETDPPTGAFPGWKTKITLYPWPTLPSPRADIGHSYGGAGFNTGDTPPGGIMQQVMTTEPGTVYTVNFKISYAGSSPDQSITVSVADGAPDDSASFGVLPGTSLYRQQYGQTAGTQSFTFTAQTAQTTLRIADTTINGTTRSTDIAMEYINVQGPFAAQQLLEDGSLTFSGANLNSLAVSDPDDDTTAYTLTASVAHGTLTPSLPLALLPGPVPAPAYPLITTPASGPATSYTFTGTLAEINRALEGMVYTPTANYNGADALILDINDHGSNGQSGVCPSYPATATPQFCDLTAHQEVPITVIHVNDAPAGSDKLGILVAEYTPYAFSATDWGFTDPVDAAFNSGANALQAVQITTLPNTGTLQLAGAAVSAGQVIPVASIPQLTWTPTPGTAGNAVASFTFQVQDDGGTANGGVDLAPSPNTISFDVAVNNPPVAVNDAYTTAQGAPALTLDLLANDTDPDNNVLHLVSLNGIAITPGTAQTIAVPNGSVTISVAGVISFTPNATFEGTLDFPYIAADPGGLTASATVSITVIPAPAVEPPATATPVPVGGSGLALLVTALLAGWGAWCLRGRRAA